MKRILVLHGSSYVSRATTLSLLRAFTQYGDLDVHYHHIMTPTEEDLRTAPFDAIFINYCFFMWRQAPYEADIVRCYDWVAKHPALKIAFPMDDCYRSGYIEDWIQFLDARIVYTALYDYRAKIYPRLTAERDMRPALTGYVDPELVPEVARFRMPLGDRPIMIGSRVARSPFSHGQFASQKADFAVGFGNICQERGFNSDVSTKPEDAFVNMAWLEFLGRCRGTPAMKGGYGLVDPRGKYREAADAYVKANPGAVYGEVAANAFGDADHMAEYSCISPRIFECAMMHTVQLMPPSNYLETLAPWRHYIPLNLDFSNADECLEALSDVKYCEELAANCYDTLIDSDWFTPKTLIEDVASQIPARATGRAKRIKTPDYKATVEDITGTLTALGRSKRMTIAHMFLYARLHKAEHIILDSLWWLKKHPFILDCDLEDERLQPYKKIWFTHSYLAQLNLLAGLDDAPLAFRCFDRLLDPHAPLISYWPWAFSGTTPQIVDLNRVYLDPQELAMDRYQFAAALSDFDAPPESADFHIQKAVVCCFNWSRGLGIDAQKAMLDALDVPPNKSAKGQKAYDGIAAAMIAIAPRTLDRKPGVLVRLDANRNRFGSEKLRDELTRLMGT